MSLEFDHFTIITSKAQETIRFFENALELELGPRPPFSDAGKWLFKDEKAIVQLLEKEPQEQELTTNIHIAFVGRDLEDLLKRLHRFQIIYRMLYLPESTTQIFFEDPNGINIEIIFYEDKNLTLLENEHEKK